MPGVDGAVISSNPLVIPGPKLVFFMFNSPRMNLLKSSF